MLKKIVLLVGYYPHQRGGAEYQAYLLAKELQQKYEVVFVSPGEQPDNVCREDGFKVYSVYVPRFRGIKVGQFRLYRRVLGILRRETPDAIYQRVANAATAASASYAKANRTRMVWHIASKANVEPLPVTIRGLFRLDLIERRFIDFGIKHSSLIVAQAEYQCRLLQTHFNRRCDAVVPNFHPLPQFKVAKDLPVRILWISNIKSLKRPELFIQLADRFKDVENISFQMVGRQTLPSFEDLLRSYEARLPRFRYLGELSQDAVCELLACSHILVNTSDFEGFPNTFVQAWMYQVPVVSLNVNPDNVLTQNGIGFHSRTFSQLVRDTRVLVDNENLRESMGQAAKDYAELNHSMRNIEALMQLLEP